MCRGFTTHPILRDYLQVEQLSPMTSQSHEAGPALHTIRFVSSRAKEAAITRFFCEIVTSSNAKIEILKPLRMLLSLTVRRSCE
jgi:hypothetical protein